MRRIPLIPIAACAVLGLSAPALAADGSVQTHIDRVMVTADDSDGGCMARLGVSPHTVLPGCAADWVSFGCSGDYVSPLRAYRMVDQAQLALATGNLAEVWFTDDNRHDGHCFVYRIEVHDRP